MRVGFDKLFFMVYKRLMKFTGFVICTCYRHS